MIAIISSGRAQAVEAMAELGIVGRWYVGAGEYHTYRVAGAEWVIESGGLCASRNQALDDAFAANEVCFQFSDDLTRMQRITDDGVVSGTLDELMADAYAQVTDNCRLVGAAPTANAYFGGQKVKRRHFIVGDFMAIAPGPLRFDETLRLKEDYDFTAQHLMTYGEVARMDWWMLAFRHKSNPGGAVAYRTVDVEDESIGRLTEKWGSWIKPNPRRPHEILFRPR